MLLILKSHPGFLSPQPTSSLLMNSFTSPPKIPVYLFLAISSTLTLAQALGLLQELLLSSYLLKSTVHTTARVIFLKHSSDYITHMLKTLQRSLLIRIQSKLFNMTMGPVVADPVSVFVFSLSSFSCCLPYGLFCVCQTQIYFCQNLCVSCCILWACFSCAFSFLSFTSQLKSHLREALPDPSSSSCILSHNNNTLFNFFLALTIKYKYVFIQLSVYCHCLLCSSGT